MKRFWFIFERVLVALLIALLFTPLATSLPHWPAAVRALQEGKSPFPKPETKPNSPALGKSDNPVGEPRPTPGASRLTRVWNAAEAFKKEMADGVNARFFGREFLIRWTNEIWFRLFRQCASPSANITVGNQDQLFEDSYLAEYCMARVSAGELEPMVRDIKAFQDVCKRLGVRCVLVVTPSKAAIYPEFVPARWMKLYAPGPRAYDIFVPLLKKHGVCFLDGRVLATQAKPKAPAPLFPKGGIHWGQYLASLVTDGVVSELRAQGAPLAPMDFRPIHVDDKPGMEDKDLINLMKLARPWRYPVSKVEAKPNPAVDGRRPSLAVIGDSFMWRMLQYLASSQQFSEINSYFYYKLYKSSNPDIDNSFFTKGTGIVRQPTGQVDFNREIYGADCLILEINEVQIATSQFLKVFLKDALANVPQEGKRGPFLFESYQPYEWNKTLSFRATDGAQIKDLCCTGFCETEDAYTWTNGPVATLRLSVPPAERDLSLKAQLGAFIVPGKIPGQNVKVFANGVPAGEWQLTSDAPASREIPLRKEWLGASKQLVLRFEISNPASPRSFKIGKDKRDLGVKFVSLLISENSRE